MESSTKMFEEKKTVRKGRPPGSKNKPKVAKRVVVKSADMVNHPPHYKAGGIETIDYIEAKGLNYNLGNAVKYISRAGLKGSYTEDLKKAVWYLSREIGKRGN